MITISTIAEIFLANGLLGQTLNSEFELSDIKKITLANRHVTGWLLYVTIETNDGNTFMIGLDKTTGVYAYEGEEQKLLWNIRP